jgi:hypothetical protein
LANVLRNGPFSPGFELQSHPFHAPEQIPIDFMLPQLQHQPPLSSQPFSHSLVPFYVDLELEPPKTRVPLGQGVGARSTTVPEATVDQHDNPLLREREIYARPRDMKSIIEAFQSIGFAVGERELTSDDVQVYLFPDQTKGQARENARNLLQRYAIFGLFAFGEEDIAYLGHREEKRK